MKQHEVLIQAMKEIGGYATLGQLYQAVSEISDCKWETKTPFCKYPKNCSTHEEFFKIRPGLWALTSEKQKVLRMFSR